MNSPPFALIQRIFDCLTEASAEVTRSESRRKARTLAVLSFGAVFAIVVSVVFNRRSDQENTAIIVLSFIFTLVNYGLSRTRYYMIGITISTLYSVVVTLAIVAFSPLSGFSATVFIIPAILFSTLFWSARITALIAAVEITGGLLLARFTPESVPDIYSAFSYLLIIAVFIVLVSVLRQKTNHELETLSRELAISENRYRGLFESTPVPLWEEDLSGVLEFLDGIQAQGVTDLKAHLQANPHLIDEAMSKLRVLDVNRATLQSLGVTDKKSLQGLPQGLIEPENRGAFLPQLMAVATHQAEYESENYQKTIDGGHSYLNVRWSVMPGYEKTFSQVVICVMDVTERYQSEMQRLELAVERERVAVLQHFINNVHHDLMTPVTALKTGLYLLDRTAVDDVQRERIRRLDTQVSFLEKLIKDMLMMLRLDSLVPDDLHFHVDDLNALMNGLVSYYHSLASSKNLKLERLIQGAIPAVRMNSEQLYRALANLLDNAIKFTPDGGTIKIITGRAGSGAYVDIQDTGPGVPDIEAERIFERFYRGEAHRPSDGGAGLGLAITRKIIEAHGGKIMVENGTSCGAIFRVWLPGV